MYEPKISPKGRELLDQIDTFLATGNDESAALWNVLTALRGPDISAQSDAKRWGTVPIRRAAFPQTAAEHEDKTSGVFIADFDPSVPVKANPDVASGENFHFVLHLAAAQASLGMFP